MAKASKGDETRELVNLVIVEGSLESQRLNSSSKKERWR